MEGADVCVCVCVCVYVCVYVCADRHGRDITSPKAKKTPETAGKSRRCESLFWSIDSVARNLGGS